MLSECFLFNHVLYKKEFHFIFADLAIQQSGTKPNLVAKIWVPNLVSFLLYIFG